MTRQVGMERNITNKRTENSDDYSIKGEIVIHFLAQLYCGILHGGEKELR